MSGPVLLGLEWKEALGELIRESRDDLIVAAPYITSDGVRFLCSNASPELCEVGRINVLTDLSPPPICQGSTEPKALLEIASAISDTRFHHLARFHAKVYIADGRQAIITSGNLTRGGLETNYEYGVKLTDRASVGKIRSDLLDYISIASALNRDQISKYCSISDNVRGDFRREQARLSAKAAGSFEEIIRPAEEELIRIKLAKGSMHSVFAAAVIRFLRREGPKTTQDIHAFIQFLHPDLCDDSVDHVIDGRRFGKKWKHAVRTAQQHLKQQGLIEYRNGLWQTKDNQLNMQ